MSKMPKALKIKVKKVSLLLIPGHTDQISIYPDWESPFPEMGYPPALDMKTRQGYGLEYCRKVLGVEPEVIDTRKMGVEPEVIDTRKINGKSV